jgi:hypothetical protein
LVSVYNASWWGYVLNAKEGNTNAGEHSRVT